MCRLESDREGLYSAVSRERKVRKDYVGDKQSRPTDNNYTNPQSYYCHNKGALVLKIYTLFGNKDPCP